ncbi:hypothetical protein OUZ56_029924 [Daphnia magna]|uniref:Mitochondrial inner membrane protease subunit 2 n=1 Tax=Daphnia magna TaxID=35525 RepID=A0ABR0B876_9CRUS|nr:hypothetical protein OUZ56_029924 [Daphnia magna]
MGKANWLRSLASGIPIGISFVSSVCYIAKVNGVSMQPILNPDSATCDYVLLNRWAVRDFHIQRGDIVSLVSPRNPDACLIKRIIGLEGDVIKPKSQSQSYVEVPRGFCWIEGENHSQSMDSNFFGPIPLGLITAKATHIVWPLNRACRLMFPNN